MAGLASPVRGVDVQKMIADAVATALQQQRRTSPRTSPSKPRVYKLVSAPKQDSFGEYPADLGAEYESEGTKKPKRQLEMGNTSMESDDESYEAQEQPKTVTKTKPPQGQGKHTGKKRAPSA